MSTFEERVLETIRRHELVSEGDKILCAVSGGPDSVAMLHTLVCLADTLKARVEVAHLNHMLRGAQAAADEQYVRRLCRQLRLPCTAERVDVARLAREAHMSLEQAARDARYRFLERVADHFHASKIAVAHTADDQVETVLLNLLRGAGLDGLAGMPVRRERVIRPLLDVSRAEVEKYCAGKGLAPRTDASNISRKMARNRMRNEVLPVLEKEQPAVRANLLRMAGLFRQESAFLNETARRRLSAITVRRGGTSLVLNATRLKRAAAALQARIIREAIRLIRGDLVDIEQHHVEAVAALIAGHSGRSLHLPGPLITSYSQGELVLSTQPLRAPSQEQHLLEIPGAVSAPSLGVLVSVELTAGAGAARARAEGPSSALLDAAAVREPLIVRAWQAGDRFHPLGAPGTMKLHDFFINQKVPRHERGRVPIVCDARGIVWVVGHRVDERCRVTNRASRALRLTATPLKDDRGANETTH